MMGQPAPWALKPLSQERTFSGRAMIWLTGEGLVLNVMSAAAADIPAVEVLALGAAAVAGAIKIEVMDTGVAKAATVKADLGHPALGACALKAEVVLPGLLVGRAGWTERPDAVERLAGGQAERAEARCPPVLVGKIVV
ncbi:hypothetical protein [Deinococcus gobiensis]|nr:hypothetical protein [Deinococcus gobiensis]